MVCGSQGSPACSVHFSSFAQKGEQQTWMRFKECNKEDQRVFLGTASAPAVTQWTAALCRSGDSGQAGLKSAELSCTEKGSEEQLLTASSAASLGSGERLKALGTSSGAAVNPFEGHSGSSIFM